MDKRTSLITRRVLNVYRDVDKIARYRAYALKASCRAGCAHCCYQYTPITLPEAIVLVAHVLAKPDGAAELDGHLERARAALAYGDKPGHRCPLLGSDNLCRAYEARPIACRTHLVVSEPELCDNAAVGEYAVQIIGMLDLHTRTLAKLGVLSLDVKLEDLWVGPLSVMVLWAAIIVREGWDAFEAAQTAPEHPMMALSRWTYEGHETRHPRRLPLVHARTDSGRRP